MQATSPKAAAMDGPKRSLFKANFYASDWRYSAISVGLSVLER